MNKNIDLTKILKDCPKGTKLYSTIFGDVEFCYIDESDAYPIRLNVEGECGSGSVTADGKHYVEFGGGECTLFPSREQRDWSKFTAPWYKKDKFDPNILKPFDRVLVRDYNDDKWVCSIFSHIEPKDSFHYACILELTCRYCIPYNEDTKHLVGTTEEAPLYYRYWEE